MAAVADPSVERNGDRSGRHPLLEKGTFEQLHRNDILETRPHIVHFGGFQIHKEHIHVLRVLNISSTSQRLSIIAPATQWFEINCDKKGLLAPGMSEEITIKFTPHEWRYYYDTVKIYCGELSENLIVPLHAYPSANSIALPRIVDFGSVAIGTSRTKVIPLSCSIPIQFEFEIEVIEAHQDFEISPLTGFIPADGTINVAVTFVPTKHRTARAELVFNISQFDFEPVAVSVVGSCMPEISSGEHRMTKQAENQAAATQAVQEGMLAKVQSMKNKRGRGPVEAKAPEFPAQRADRSVDGVKVPQRFDPQSTRFVLNQTAGKLPLKDLFSFIRDQREAAERRRRKAEAGRQAGGDAEESGAEEPEEEDDDTQALELRFEMQFREVERYDHEKDLKSMVATGEDVLNENELARVRRLRQIRHERLMESRIREDAGRFESVLGHERVAVPNNYVSGLKPHWDENTNDMFSMRLQVIDRFVRAGAKCLMRTRAAANLARLKEAMASANVMDRASCRAWVDAENKLAAASGGTQKCKSAGAADADAAGKDEDDVDSLSVVRIPRGFILPEHMPTTQSLASAEDRQPVEVDPLENFEEFPPIRLNARLDWKVLRYDLFKAPPMAAYMRPHKDRQRLEAALEELSVRGPRGDIMDGAEKPVAMPESCLLAPVHDALSLLIPSTECRTYVALPEYAECDFEYKLAQLPPPIEPLDIEPLIPEDLMSLEQPWLGTWRRKRRLQDPLEFWDPEPGSFAEAGGSWGPRLGADAGGERLNFMPVGGYSRDIPSDTDSDEREDFELPAPSKEEYDAALRRMSGPVSSERWRKEKRMEDRLQAQCAENNRAVRDRLRELNVDLHPRNKLYLG